MRTAALTFILMLLSQGCSAQTGLYLIALMGQSNMEGRGELSELPAGFPANPTKLWNFTNAYQWEPARSPSNSPEGQVDVISIGRRGGVGPSGACRRLRVRSSRNVGWVDSLREGGNQDQRVRGQRHKPATRGARSMAHA